MHNIPFDTQMLDTKENVVDYINQHLKSYEGYVQFSHRPLDLSTDIFPTDADILEPKGFVLEAHFCKDNISIMIRQINNEWKIEKTEIANNAEIDYYNSLSTFKVKMAQIWADEEDENCCNFNVKKLQKVVFAGFEPIAGKGGKND